ncbi:hypothetical protein D6861_010375 [Macrococcoides caseolyticum]|nr:hypothetical protein [Macrococcus caseolyticus]RKO14096.1 hypothetical protein D6861_08315 [Macrococcus caseolyticus]
MAFEFNSEKSEKIKKALKKNDTNTRVNAVDNESSFLKEISDQPKHEIKQRYNIMLDPSIKEKADKIAKEKNFKSTSSFINELIKSL